MSKKDLSIEVEGKVIPFEVEYRNRKSLEIQVNPEGKVRVLSPFSLSEKELLKHVESKSSWILTKRNDFNKIDLSILEKNIKDGEKFLYLGQSYELKIIRDSIKTTTLSLLENQMILKTSSIDQEYLKNFLIQWYKEKGLKKIKERVEFYQPYILVKPTDIVVKEQKRRWGSCTSKGRLLFNWRIIMAPLSVLDYIVVHEMCHLIHMNHGKEFWTCVERILPNYKKEKNWLKRNGIYLDIKFLK